jgi:hypothetical protein
MKRLAVVLTVTVLSIGTVRGYLAAKERPERYPCSFEIKKGGKWRGMLSLDDAQRLRRKAVKVGHSIPVRLRKIDTPQVPATIKCVARAYGMDPAPFLSVAECESHSDPEAHNPAGPYTGIFQYLPSTWAAVSAANGHAGASITDAYSQIHSTVRHVKAHDWGQWGICI